MANATFTAKFTTAGTFTWVCPAGVTAAQVECWGSGAPSVAAGSGLGGGGGGEYAAEPALAVTAGNSYTVVVGAASIAGTTGTSASSTVTGGSPAVTAHGGTANGTGSQTGGAGGTGSTNTTHHNGGAGGNGNGTTGGGGGGSGGTAAAGNAGSTGASGGAGAVAVTGGAAGGNAQTAGSAPGGGAGGVSGSNAAAGKAGQVVITWTMASTATISASTTGGTYQWTAPSGITSASWTISGTASFDGHTSTSTESVVAGTAYTISVASSSSLAISWIPPNTSTGSAALPKMGISGTGLALTGGHLVLPKAALSGTGTQSLVISGSAGVRTPVLAGRIFQGFPFPAQPLILLFELLVGDTWTDITDFVYQRQTITIVRGRPDESATVNPATCTFTLNNRDGRFSPRNPASPYYLLIGRNTQLRVSAPTAVIPSPLSYRFWGEVAEWPPTWDNTGQDITVQITANGILRRLNQNAALRSALFRYYQTLAAPPLAYWPAEDGSAATSLSSGLTTGFPMTFSGAPSLASDSGLPASSPFPSFNGATFTGATGIAGALPVAQTTVLSTTGTHTWIAPPDITSVLVQAWGAGGGGSGYNGNTGGAGGGGSEYASGSLAVTPGNSYSYTVGASSAGVSGGSSVMHGDSSTSITAHGGTAGSSDGATGGAGGTGSTAATHFDGGAGAAGSGGPGGGGSSNTTQQNLAYTSDATFNAPADIDGTVTAYVWGAGGGGGGGGSSSGGGGGGGGGFSQGSHSVSGGSNYPVKVGQGGAGGASGGEGTVGGQSYFNSSGTIQADGGQPGHAAGTTGSGGSGNTHSGGHGGSGTTGNKGGGGGGGASIDGGGGNGTDSAGGGAGGNGGSGNGTINGGGHGGDGGSSAQGARNGADGAPTGAGGGGAYTRQFGATPSGGGGGRGKVWLFWSETVTMDPPDAGIGGGGGSSGGSASAGNDGDVELGGAAVTGGGPGGGTLAGSSFMAAPSSTPGGGGGGYDSLGNAAAGAQGLITLSYAPAGSGSSTTAANVLRFVLHTPDGGDTDGGVVAQMETTGTIAYIQVIYNVANAGSLTLSGFSGAGAQLFTTGEVAFGCDNQYLLVSAELTPSGSNIAYTLTGIFAGQTVAAATSSGTLTAATLGDAFVVIMDPNGDMASATWAHAAIQESGYDPVTSLAGPLAAYAGETASQRFTRICTEQNIPFSVIDAGVTDTTALVGPQLPVKVPQILQDCEDADRGLIFETRDALGMAYRTRSSLYAQAAAMQLDYGAGELGFPLQPTDDDQLLRNDVTISRPSGSSAEFQVTSGTLSIQDPPAGVGPYTFSQSINVDSDEQLEDLASWITFIGTVDQLRYPVVYVDLARAEIGTDFADVVNADIGDYLQVVNTGDAPLPPGDIRQLVYGYTEELNAYTWTLSMNCVPESPYEIAQAGDCRADTDGSQLHSGIGNGDISFAVDTPVPNQPWVDSTGYSGEFPFDIIVTGERMTVTGIDGASSPQTFTVSRGVNGVQKPHNAGESVNLYQPAITAL